MRYWQQMGWAPIAAALLAACVVTSDAAAQKKRGKVPPGHLPPPGSCRVWYDGRPPGHQPPATDCATARRVAYETGGRVLDGGGARSTVASADAGVTVAIVVDSEWDHVCDARDRRGECVVVIDERRAEPDVIVIEERSRHPDVIVIDERDERDEDEDDVRGRCDDRNRDGWCDDLGTPPTTCVDRDRNGRCDEMESRAESRTESRSESRTESRSEPRVEPRAEPRPAPAPRTEPRIESRDRNARPTMVWAIVVARGGTSVEVERWFGASKMRVRYEDADKNGVPEVATWYDADGNVRERWIDDNRDGQADRVGVYENGRIARIVK